MNLVQVWGGKESMYDYKEEKAESKEEKETITRLN
jgi:hypothetical protein